MPKGCKRELAALAVDYNTDGRRGTFSERDPKHDPSISSRMRELFHSGHSSWRACGGGRLLEPLRSAPNVYLVRHFLSPRELDHLDDLLTDRRKVFKQSHTDHGAEDGLRSSERTSSSLALPKAADSVLRSIEARAADLVGLPADFVEPIQVRGCRGRGNGYGLAARPRVPREFA